MYGKNFTIVIPTYRRSHFLPRMIGGLSPVSTNGTDWGDCAIFL